ncbi:conjugal transfer protein TraB [Streptomyces sp. NPDC048445]|uniref:conjugal transfer protein TraB n=1 Tax=Streptomyces sp. NPDC048445 TaxID=3365553 RepID=UPI00371FC371
MSTFPVPRPANAPAQDDGDNRYKTVQSKLKRLAAALDNATDEMTSLQRRLRANADRAETVAGHIAHAELDRKFIEMTNAVSVALGGSAVEAHRMHEKVQDVAAAAHDARQTHAKKYGPLDEVRSSRKERTPKPAFFTR